MFAYYRTNTNAYFSDIFKLAPFGSPLHCIVKLFSAILLVIEKLQDRALVRQVTDRSTLDLNIGMAVSRFRRMRHVSVTRSKYWLSPRSGRERVWEVAPYILPEELTLRLQCVGQDSRQLGTCRKVAELRRLWVRSEVLSSKAKKMSTKWYSPTWWRLY